MKFKLKSRNSCNYNNILICFVLFCSSICANSCQQINYSITQCKHDYFFQIIFKCHRILRKRLGNFAIGMRTIKLCKKTIPLNIANFLNVVLWCYRIIKLIKYNYSKGRNSVGLFSTFLITECDRRTIRYRLERNSHQNGRSSVQGLESSTKSKGYL